MSSITDAADLLARIDTLDAESVRLHSDLSGPMDLATSLHEHFNQALGFTDLFPVDLSDHDLRQQLIGMQTIRVFVQVAGKDQLVGAGLLQQHVQRGRASPAPTTPA